MARAVKIKNGPRPLRSLEYPLGLPTLDAAEKQQALLGNTLLDKSVEAALAVLAEGGDFSLENPERSLLWNMPSIQFLKIMYPTFVVSFDQCCFGSVHLKPTTLLTSQALLQALSARCKGGHKHVPLKGKVWNKKDRKWVFRTKAAQVYPKPLFEAIAQKVSGVFFEDCPQFAQSFLLRSADRKRPLGMSEAWLQHRQNRSVMLAQAAGYQLKRGAVKPLLDVECEPGDAIRWALSVPHPFSIPLKLQDDLLRSIDQVCKDPEALCRWRLRQLQHWHDRAVHLLPATDALLTQIQDRHLRRLLRGVPDGQAAQLGVTTHIELYKEMLQAAQCPDGSIVEDMLHGFRIVGKIRPSGRWPPYEKAQDVLSVSDALARAWEIRRKIVRRVAAVQRSDNLKVIWEATLEDVLEGSCLGPLGSEREVSGLVQADDWIPTQRFEVVQKNKVRGCDSATTNMINKITEISEKLQLPSTDYNVAVIRELRSRLATGSSPSLEGWVLDEKKAYRQIPIHPSHRKFSVICLKDPDDGKVKFFVMVGHSFGLVSAVYNYNRRSAAINDILVNLFFLVAFNFYDDKYGFEPSHSYALAHDVAQKVHWWLGAAFDVKKLQRSKKPDVLGVTYNLEEFKLKIQQKRRAELKEAIEDILQKESLDPGSAGKLKGKLMSGASQLWGKVGRAFLRSLGSLSANTRSTLVMMALH